MQYKKLFVFPTSRAIRNFISQDNSNRLLHPTLTIDDLIFKSINIGNLNYIDEERRFLFLKESTNVKEFEKLGILNNFNDFINQSEYIFRFFGELSAENIEFSSIQKADTYEFYEDHLRILEEIYTRYCDLLDKNNYVDKITLPRKYVINKDFLSQFEEVNIYFEGYFTHFEFNLITQIAKHTKLIIHLKTNKYNKKSYEKFINYGFDLKTNHNYILNISNKLIIEEKKNIKQKQNIQINGFALRTNQIGFIKKSITTMIENGLKPHEIAVIVPNEKFVEQIELFDTDSYFNYAMGRSITTSKLYTKAHALYEYLTNDEKKEIDYIKFLKLDFEYILQNFKNSWNKQITKDIFVLLTQYLKQDETNEDILEKFEEECYALENIVFNYNDSLTLKEVYKFLLQKINAIKIDDTTGFAITVMGLLETRGLDFKGLVIVDFNEDTVPKRSIKDKFLSTSVKKHSNLPTKNDRENLQKYYYYELCKNAKEVYVSYIKNDQSSISRFASELFDVKVNEVVYDNVYKSLLLENLPIHHFNEEIIIDIDLSLQEWSATSLKTYLQCKRKYYFSYIAKIKEHHFSPKPQSFEIGNAIHTILENFYKNHNFIDESFSNNSLDNYFLQIKQSNPFMILDLELWRRKLEKFIQNEKNEFKSKNKRVFKTEHPFKFKYNNTTLKGVIDRIDKINNDENSFEIIDYKTSSSISIDTLKTYENSVDFQLEFYYLAMQNFLEEQNIQNYKVTSYYYDLNNTKLLEELVIDEKIILLEKILKELKTSQVNFEQCDKATTCLYCPYKTICNK